MKFFINQHVIWKRKTKDGDVKEIEGGVVAIYKNKLTLRFVTEEGKLKFVSAKREEVRAFE